MDRQRWGISKLVELYIKRKLPLKKYGVIPKHSFLLEMNSCGISTVPKGFYENVEKGSIILKKSPNTISFFKEGVVLDEHEYVKSDLVILATGFNGDQKLKHIFESQTFQDYIYGSSKDSVPLHRLVFASPFLRTSNWIIHAGVYIYILQIWLSLNDGLVMSSKCNFGRIISWLV